MTLLNKLSPKRMVRSLGSTLYRLEVARMAELVKEKVQTPWA